MDSTDEFKTFLDALNMLGVQYEINWGMGAGGRPQDDERHVFWQNIIREAGHNFTSRATVLVTVNALEFLFTTNGVFVLTRNTLNGIVQPHLRLNASGKPSGGRRIIQYTDGDQTYGDLCKIDERAR